MLGFHCSCQVEKGEEVWKEKGEEVVGVSEYFDWLQIEQEKEAVIITYLG